MPHAKLFFGDDPMHERPMTAPYPGMEKGELLPELIAALRNGHDLAIDEVDVFRVMDICFAVRDSMSSGKTVSVDYLI